MDADKTGRINLSESERANLVWLKARSSGANGQCVEIGADEGKIAMRDSKDPDGPILVFSKAEFRAFLEGARTGEFDDLLRD